MPKRGDMRMTNGLIHEVLRVVPHGAIPHWTLRCDEKSLYADGTGTVRVGQWTYPTCLRCAAR